MTFRAQCTAVLSNLPAKHLHTLAVFPLHASTDIATPCREPCLWPTLRPTTTSSMWT